VVGVLVFELMSVNPMTFTDEHLQKLFRYGVSLTRNDAQAYDLLQDALETYLKKPPANDASSMGYIRSVMRNRFIDQYRQRSRFPEQQLDDEEETLSIDERLLEDIVITHQELDTVWQKLSLVECELMFLWAIEELSASEIATELEMPRGTVLSRIYRLRNRLNNESSTSNEEASV